MNRRKFLQTTLLPLALQSASSLFHSKAFAQAVRQGDTMDQPAQRIIETNGIRLNIAEQGQGTGRSPVPRLPGVPGIPGATRYGALAAAGFHAVAPDMRGYGKSDATKAIDQYTHLPSGRGSSSACSTCSMQKAAVVVGHDVGATRGLAGRANAPGLASAPSLGSVSRSDRAAKVRPTSVMPRTAERRILHALLPRGRGLPKPNSNAIRARHCAACCSAHQARALPRRALQLRQAARTPNLGMVPKGGRFLRGPGRQATLPVWLTEADVDFYASRIQAERLPRTPELLSQSRSQLGNPGRTLWGAGHCARALHCGGSRPHRVIPRHGPAHRQPEPLRAGLAEGADAPRVRALDAAGARGGS